MEIRKLFESLLKYIHNVDMELSMRAVLQPIVQLLCPQYTPFNLKQACSVHAVVFSELYLALRRRRSDCRASWHLAEEHSGCQPYTLQCCGGVSSGGGGGASGSE